MFAAKIERDLFDDDVYIIEDPAIKSEYTEDSKETATQSVPLAEQEMTVSQSNANDNFEDSNQVVSTTTTDMAAAKTPEPDHDVMKFYCAHCQDANCRNDVFSNAQEVHDHWLMKHSKLAAPFQFYAGFSCICIVCKERFRISEIKRHFQVVHPMQPFGMASHLDENNCAICEYNGTDLADHFLGSHQIVIDADLFNPMRLTKDDIFHLSSIEVHKKYRCNGCMVIFEIQQQAIDHKCSHAKRELEVFHDKIPSYFECGLCGCHMQRTHAKTHFSKEHDFECWNCDLVESNLDALIVHHNVAHIGLSMEKTKIELGKAYLQSKIIFGNGLILNNANVLHASDNEYDKIQEFFEPLPSNLLPSEEISTPCTSVESNAMTTPEPVSEADLTEEEKQTELELQKKLLSSVIVYGMTVGNDYEIQNALLKLFKHIKVPLVSDDIHYVRKLSQNAVAVKFRERPKKELLLNAASLKGLKTDDFLQLPPGRKPEIVNVHPRLTKIYVKIAAKARFYLQKKTIHSYRITSQGCSIKMVQGGYEHHVRSVNELDNFVEGKVLYQQKRKCNERLETLSPKRNKCA